MILTNTAFAFVFHLNTFCAHTVNTITSNSKTLKKNVTQPRLYGIFQYLSVQFIESIQQIHYPVHFSPSLTTDDTQVVCVNQNRFLETILKLWHFSFDKRNLHTTHTYALTRMTTFTHNCVKQKDESDLAKRRENKNTFAIAMDEQLLVLRLRGLEYKR